MKKTNKSISAKEFDKKFDNGEDIMDYLDLKSLKAHKKVKRINIDFPAPFLNKIDREAAKMGIARTALIKVWLAERLQAKGTTN